jgi:hypothetical protein
MNTLIQATAPQSIAISAPEREAAGRYISAIIAHDRLTSRSTDLAELRTRQLMDQFVAAYTAVTTGPYARRGSDALRLALSRL